MLGIPLMVGGDRRYGNSPSVDRVKPELGYVKGNILVCSLRANRIKQDATPAELMRVAEFFRRYA